MRLVFVVIFPFRCSLLKRNLDLRIRRRVKTFRHFCFAARLRDALFLDTTFLVRLRRLRDDARRRCRRWRCASNVDVASHRHGRRRQDSNSAGWRSDFDRLKGVFLHAVKMHQFKIIHCKKMRLAKCFRALCNIMFWTTRRGKMFNDLQPSSYAITCFCLEGTNSRGGVMDAWWLGCK